MCDFFVYHFRGENVFDRSCIYGDVRIGVVLYGVGDSTYYCVDFLDLQTHEGIHMDSFTFAQCVQWLKALTAPNIELPQIDDNADLTIKQIPLTNTYKVTHKDQQIIFDLIAIEEIIEIWKWLNYKWL